MVKHLTYTLTVEEKRMDWVDDRQALREVGVAIRRRLLKCGFNVYKLSPREARDRPTDQPALKL